MASINDADLSQVGGDRNGKLLNEDESMIHFNMKSESDNEAGFGSGLTNRAQLPSLFSLWHVMIDETSGLLLMSLLYYDCFVVINEFTVCEKKYYEETRERNRVLVPSSSENWSAATINVAQTMKPLPSVLMPMLTHLM